MGCPPSIISVFIFTCIISVFAVRTPCSCWERTELGKNKTKREFSCGKILHLEMNHKKALKL